MTKVFPEPPRGSAPYGPYEFLALRVAELGAKLNEWHDDNGHFGAFMFCENTVCKTFSSWLEYVGEARAELPAWHPLHPRLTEETADE